MITQADLLPWDYFKQYNQQVKADCVFAGALIRPVATTGRTKGHSFRMDRQRLEDTCMQMMQ